jgi:hypothetical protein
LLEGVENFNQKNYIKTGMQINSSSASKVTIERVLLGLSYIDHFTHKIKILHNQTTSCHFEHAASLHWPKRKQYRGLKIVPMVIKPQ